MISTTSNRSLLGLWLFVCLTLVMAACTEQQPSKTDAHPNRVPVAVGETVQTVPEPPQPSPKEQEAVPDPPKKESPYYGSTYWDELLTSVYFYPKDSNTDFDGTHLKFNHREDDIWLCGDQRKSFKAGRRIKLTITFEPNQPCATNWQIE